jgi:hypothetical protein
MGAALMRVLDRHRPYKPLDVGNGIVSGTVTPSGRWLSLGIAHPVHGRVELTTMEPFTGSRFDQSEVRAYREALADPKRPSFGFDLLDAEPSSVWLAEDSFPAAVVERPEGRFESVIVAPAGRSGAVQIVRFKATMEIRGPTWTSAMRLARAEYTQLTAGGPLADAHSHNRMSMHQRDDWPDSLFLIEDRALGAAATMAATYAEIAAGSDAAAVLVVSLGLDPMATMTEAHELARDAESLVEQHLGERRRLWAGLDLAAPTAQPARRGVSYAIDCAATRTGDALAFLADTRSCRSCGREMPITCVARCLRSVRASRGSRHSSTGSSAGASRLPRPSMGGGRVRRSHRGLRRTPRSSWTSSSGRSS